MTKFLWIALLLFSAGLPSLSSASSNGIYHSYFPDLKCPGQEIYLNDKASARRFHESFLDLLMNDESDQCARAFGLNITAYVEGLIHSGDQENYDLFHNALNEIYQEKRIKEKRAGTLCRFDEASKADTPSCESDRLINITQLSFLAWHGFFKKPLQDELAFQEGAVIAGSFGTGFTLFALANRDVRSQSVRFVVNSGKHFLRMIRATGTITRSVGSSLGRGAMLGRGAVAARTGVVGAGAGTGAAQNHLNQREQLEVIRSTENFPIPFSYLDVQKEQSLIQWGLSYVPSCLKSSSSADSTDFGFRKTGCQSAMDLSIALTAGILPAYIVQKRLYKTLVKGPLYALGSSAIMKRAVKQSVRRAVRIGKSPVTMFLAGVVAVGTIGKAVTETYQAQNYRNTLRYLESNIEKLKGFLSRVNGDPTQYLVDAWGLASYSDSLAMFKAAPMVDRLENIKVRAISDSICTPLTFMHEGYTDRATVQTAQVRAQSRLETETSKAFGRHPKSDEYAKANQEFLEEAIKVLATTQRFLSDDLNHPERFGLKASIYERLEYLFTFRRERTFLSHTRKLMQLFFEGSYENAKKLYQFRQAVNDKNFDASAATPDEWRGYIEASAYFNSLKAAVESGGRDFQCPYGRAYEFFLEEIFLAQAPCNLGTEYTNSLKHCQGI